MKPNLPLIFLYHLMPTTWASLCFLADIVLEQSLKLQDKSFASSPFPLNKSPLSIMNPHTTTSYFRSPTLSATNLSTYPAKAHPVQQTP